MCALVYMDFVDHCHESCWSFEHGHLEEEWDLELIPDQEDLGFEEVVVDADTHL